MVVLFLVDWYAGIYPYDMSRAPFILSSKSLLLSVLPVWLLLLLKLLQESRRLVSFQQLLQGRPLLLCRQEPLRL